MFLSEYASIIGESTESIANSVFKEFFLSKRFVRCDICQKWMEVTDNRKSKTTHVKCSKNQYAGDRRKAIALWGQGKTIEEIVNEINEAKEDSSKKRKPEQIRGWIEKAQTNDL